MIITGKAPEKKRGFFCFPDTQNARKSPVNRLFCFTYINIYLIQKSPIKAVLMLLQGYYLFISCLQYASISLYH